MNKINAETIVALLTNLVGLATMCFGMSKETAETLDKAIPTIVGGAMTLAATISYMWAKHKARVAVFTEMSTHTPVVDGDVSASAAKTTIVEHAKSCGLI